MGRLPGSSVLILASGWLIYLSSVIIRVQKNEYEAAFCEPFFGLVAAASIWVLHRSSGPHASPSTRSAPLWRVAACVPLLISILSLCAFLLAYRSVALHDWLRPGQPAAQKYSVDLAGYDGVAREIRSAAALCRISPGQPLHHLVVDETTYFVFQTSEEPLFAAYFDDRGWARYRPDPTSLLREQGSDGFVAACNRLPTLYTERARQHGEFCCLPAFTAESNLPPG